MIKKSGTKKDEIKYKVIEECGTVGERNGDYIVKLRYVSWNDGDPKYDIRPWKQNEDGSERPSKGITLSGEELEELGKIIDRLKK